MSSIVSNQRRAYLAQAEDAARTLGERLKSIPPAEQVALLASTAAQAGCPVDLVFTTPHRSDALDAALLLDGDLTPSTQATWAWSISSGCLLQIVVTQEDHE